MGCFWCEYGPASSEVDADADADDEEEEAEVADSEDKFERRGEGAAEVEHNV